MNDTTHSPSPEFRAFLDYEIGRVARHSSRRRPTTQWMRVTALLLACAGIGVTTAFASAQVRDGARRDSLLQSARADLQIAGVRLDLARAQYDETTRQSQVGAASAEAQEAAQVELRAREAQAMRAKYNIEEITLDAQPPRDDLNAPLVGGRDFVYSRLELDAMVAQERLKAAEADLGEAQRRVRVGAVEDGVELQAKQRLARARADFAVLATKLGLRKEFLAKHTPVDSLLARLGHVQLQQDVMVASERANVAGQQLALVEKQHAVGQAADLDLLKAKVEAEEAQIELQRLAAKLNGKNPEE